MDRTAPRRAIPILLRRSSLAVGLLALVPALPAAGQSVADPEPTLRQALAAMDAGHDSAARAGLLAVVADLPQISGWLLRRAAIVTADSAARTALYARLRRPLVRQHILDAEAEARERSGDPLGAALRYDSLGRVVDAARLRLGRARTPMERARQAQVLVHFIQSTSGSPEADSAADLLLRAARRLPPTDALIVARSSAHARNASRAVDLFRQAFRAGSGTAADRVSYGRALARLRRYSAAIAALRRVTAPESLAAKAALAAADVRLVRRDTTGAATALARLLKRYPENSSVVPTALFRAGEIAWRRGKWGTARRWWKELDQRFPAHELAPRAAFLAALAAYESGETRVAAEEWQQVHLRNATGSGAAAGYWAGRAWAELGEPGRAELMWRSVIARDSLGYYAMASARRLRIEPWRPPEAPDRFLPYPDLETAVARMNLLRRVGLTPELEWERAALLAQPARSSERMLAVADAFRRSGQAAFALSLARRALQAGAPADRRTYRLIFPLPYGDDLEKQADRSRVDPSLVAGLIRQESAWDPAAVSRVGAMGLMQLMPATGRALARASGVRHWSSERLFEPEVNLELGTRYLAESLRRFHGDLTFALAAYNAGPTRVRQWRRGRAADDPDLFLERIGFAETRDYVRLVRRNMAAYQVLYPPLAGDSGRGLARPPETP